jgi:hemolysin activation/secretion protein
VVRLSPASTLALRFVGGSTTGGTLTRQKQFTTGGVDGLRARAIASIKGDQLMLAQAEYTLGLWRVRSGIFDGGLHAIAFIDMGQAWFNPANRWDVHLQQIQIDGGLGLSTSEDNLRVYFARRLDQEHSPALVTLRLQRPF